MLGTVPSEAARSSWKASTWSPATSSPAAGREGGIVKREAAIYACKVQVVCPKCDKGTRVAHKVEDGKKTRVCKKCGAEI